MSAQHTPGPWLIRSETQVLTGEVMLSVVARDVKPGSGAVAWPCGTNDAQQFANALLIAAAPELLECVRNAAMNCCGARRARYLAAIEKATGGAA